jgi:hypothetical protein
MDIREMYFKEIDVWHRLVELPTSMRRKLRQGQGYLPPMAKVGFRGKHEVYDGLVTGTQVDFQ